MKKYCLLAFAFLFAIIVSAQTVPRSQRPISYVVKWSPLHFLGRYPTLQIGVEQRLRKNFSVFYDGGVAFLIPDINVLADSKTYGYRGFKTKLEVRRYFNTTGYKQYYCAQELFYNHLTARKEDQFAVRPDPSDPSQDYQRRMAFRVRYQEYGTVLKAGIFTPLGRFCFDIHAGVAFGLVHERYEKMPASPTYTLLGDETPGGLIYDIFNTDGNLYVYPTIGLRLGYIIK